MENKYIVDGETVLHEEDLKIIVDIVDIETGEYTEVYDTKTQMPEYDGCLYQLKDVVEWAEELGYNGGTILLIAESFLSGRIFRYNNYGKQEWRQIGTMEGFA